MRETEHSVRFMLIEGEICNTYSRFWWWYVKNETLQGIVNTIHNVLNHEEISLHKGTNV